MLMVPILFAQDPVRKPETLTLTLATIDDSAIRDEYIFVINGVSAYRTVDGLKRGIKDVPAGSTLTWAPSCLRSENLRPEPLSAEKDIAAFADYCKSLNIMFIIVPSG